MKQSQKPAEVRDVIAKDRKLNESTTLQLMADLYDRSAGYCSQDEDKTAKFLEEENNERSND